MEATRETRPTIIVEMSEAEAAALHKLIGRSNRDTRRGAWGASVEESLTLESLFDALDEVCGD